MAVYVDTYTIKKRFECDICGRRFLYNRGLLQHVRIHTSEKPYKCINCGAQFTRNDHLERHIRIHTVILVVHNSHVIVI